jgi:chromosome segregation ATPase
MSIDQSTNNDTHEHQFGHEERPDEMSGMWIRDQLKDPAEATPLQESDAESVPAPVAQIEPVETSGRVEASSDALSPIVANLARSISAAVAEPLESFERERRADAAAVAESVREHAHRITAAFSALQCVEEASRQMTKRVEEQETPIRESRELVDRLQGRTEEIQSDVRREAEQIHSSIGSLRSELEGFAQRLTHSEGLIEQQRAALARLETLERRRVESLGEMSRLMGNMQQALQPVEFADDESSN